MILFSPCKLDQAPDGAAGTAAHQPVRYCACTRPCGVHNQPKHRAQEAQAA